MDYLHHLHLLSILLRGCASLSPVIYAPSKVFIPCSQKLCSGLGCEIQNFKTLEAKAKSQESMLVAIAAALLLLQLRVIVYSGGLV